MSDLTLALTLIPRWCHTWDMSWHTSQETLLCAVLTSQSN